jgi:hypothetical protein
MVRKKLKGERQMADGNEEMYALDACVFSGDLLHYNLYKFKKYLERWQRAVKDHEEFMEELI